MVTEIIGELEGKGKALNQYSRFNDLPLEYDKSGNLSAKGSRLFAYDYRNRLIRSSRGDDAVTFTYDIFGRQTSRTDLSGTCRFFYAGDQKIEERNASGQVTKHYLWGNGIDELLRLDIYNGNSSTPYYVHTDNIGSTTAITDGSGSLVERVTYDVYGVPTFTDALCQTLKKSTIRNTTLFQGREYDYDLALYNYRARYLDPSLGRFLQTDPLGYQDSMNLYQGMGMNPVNFVDPWGLVKVRINYIGIYAKDPSKIPGSYSLDQFPFGNIYQYLSRVDRPAAGILIHSDANSLNYLVRRKNDKFYAEYDFHSTMFIYVCNGFYSKSVLEHERSHLVGYKLRELELLFQIRKEEDKGYQTINECALAAEKLVEKKKALIAPSWWPDAKGFWWTLNDWTIGLVFDKSHSHYRIWEKFQNEFDETKIDGDLAEFERAYKRHGGFDVDRYKK